MLKSVITTILIFSISLPAFAFDDVLDILDPVCVQNDKAKPEVYSSFVNGTNLQKWEIRLLKKGNFFNYEICYDKFNRTNLAENLPQTFAHKDDCQLAYKNWIHMRAHDAFKYYLKEALVEEMESQQTRETFNQTYDVLIPAFKAADFFVDHYVEVVLPSAFLYLYFFNHISTKGRFAGRMARGNAWLSGGILAITVVSWIKHSFFEGEKAPTIVNEKGEVVSETSLSGQELAEVIDELEQETGLTEKQIPLLIRFSYFALKKAIPKALQKTYELNCTDQT